jgi:hypothetical protein
MTLPINPHFGGQLPPIEYKQELVSGLEPFLTQFMPAQTPSATLTAALNKYSDKLLSGNDKEITAALNSLASELGLSEKFSAFIPLIAATLAHLDPAQIKTLGTLLDAMSGVKDPTVVRDTSTTYEGAVDPTVVDSYPEFPSLQGVDPALIKLFNESVKAHNAGTLTEEKFESILDDILQGIKNDKLSTASKPHSAEVNAWIFSCVVECFKVSSLISDLLIQMERDNGKLAIKMKQALFSMAMDCFNLAIKMTDARVNSTMAEVASLILEGVCSVLQATISAVGIWKSARDIKNLGPNPTPEQITSVTRNVDLWKSMGSSIVTAAQDFAKAGITVDKANQERIAGYTEAMKELVGKIFQLIEGTLRKTDEDTGDMKKMIHDLFEKLDALARLSGEIRG